MATQQARRQIPDDRPWAIYTRLSRKKAERPGSRRVRADDETVQRQETLCRTHAGEHGLPLDDAHVYVDNNRSAWRDGATRPDWERMIAAAQRGEIAGILAWRVDRFVRRIDDAVDLVKVARDNGLRIDGPGSGEFDLTTREGIDDFYDAAQSAAKESTRISGRVRVALADIRSQGYPVGGTRVFGFDSASGVTHRTDEVALLREAARRMLDGESIARISTDFGARGVQTTRGTTFTAANLGRMLGNRRYGGEVVHDGEVVARMPGEPVFDADTYERVQAMLGSRRRGRRPTDRYELTGLIRCGACGRSLAGATATQTRAKGTTSRLYRCPVQSHGCGMAIKADAVEARVRERVLKLLADPDTLRDIGDRGAEHSAARAKIIEELALIEAQIDEHDEKVSAANRGLRTSPKPHIEATLRKRWQAAQAALSTLGTSSAALALPAMNEQEWDGLTPHERRMTIVALNIEMTVLPTFPDGRGNRVDERRIVITPDLPKG